MNMRAALRALAALTILTGLSGCVALAVGAAGSAAGVVYVKGRLVDRLNAPVERVYNATLDMLNAKGLTIKSHDADVASAEVRSEFGNGDEIRITIDSITSEVSEIKIRVGLTGDQRRSIDLLEGIKARL